MSDISVLSRTQIIRVNPTSRAVSVINAGPQGPGGPAGALTEEMAVDAAAGALIGENNVEITYDDIAGEITVRDKPDLVTHDWNVQGWTPFDEILVSDDVGSHTSQTTSVANSRGRITNSGTQGNLRKAYKRDDTLWMDSEITSLCYGSDVYSSSGTNPCTAQGGHFHRGYVDGSGVWRAIMLSNNIFGTDANRINANVWNSSPSAVLSLGTNGGAKVYTDDHLQRKANIIGVNRFVFGISFNEYFVMPKNHGLEAGVSCTVDADLDSTFDIATAQAIFGVSARGIQFQDMEGGAAVASKYESGSIIPTSASARRYWPYWLKSRLIGSKLSVKVWRQYDPEPDWGDPVAVFTCDFAGANVPTPGALYPDQPGYCGVLGAHIRNTRYFEYGSFSARKL
jgi:hypothetical protein